MISHYLTFDLGASSGRVIVVTLDNGNIIYDEVHRFSNQPFKENNVLYWNFKHLINQIKKGLQLAFKKYPNIKSVGIDTWGVDYGLIDYNGNLLRNPICYRDQRTSDIHNEVYKVISKENLYKKTGIQYMHFNTIYQLTYDAIYNQELLNQTDKILLIPDLIAYYLTGVKRIELTNLSTTNFYNPHKKELISELEYLGIDKKKIPDLIYPGSVYGKIKESLSILLNIPQVDVVAVCSHDTASAILSIPMNKKHIYISSGTWSLCGTLLKKPNTGKLAEQENYTNEVGFKEQIRFLKNIMGLWIPNQCIKQWSKEGYRYEFTELEQLALESRPFISFIDPDDPIFEPPGNMVDRVKDYCYRTGQIVPVTHGEILRCIYESLAYKYRFVIEKLEKIVKQKYKKIVIVGGGTNIEVLNQMTASACNKEVVIGATEATILGNALVLMLQDGVIKSIEEGKKMIKKFVGKTIYQPLQFEEYDLHYNRFCEIIEKGK